MPMSKPAQQLFTVAVGQGIKTVDFLRQRMQADSGTGYYKNGEIAAAVGATQPSVARVLMTLSRHGVIQNRMGPNGGYQITPEQLERHTVLDLIYYLGQDVPEPVGDDAFEKLKGRVYDFLNIPLEDFLK